MEKAIIYQIFTRLFGNTNTTRKHNGTLTDNGCGKLNAFTPAVLRRIKELGATHVWYTGVIRHATTTDYTRYGIPRQHPAVVKGNAGSPYAITDYYDIVEGGVVILKLYIDRFFTCNAYFLSFHTNV